MNAPRLYWKNKLENEWNPFVRDRVKKLPIHYSVKEGIEAITKIHIASLKPRTKETYNYVVKLFVAWLTAEGLDRIRLGDLTKQQTGNYLDSLITEKGFSGRTHNGHLIILATLFNAMAGKDWIAKNPIKKIERKPAQVRRSIAFSDKEKDDLRKLLLKQDEQMYYFTQIMYFTFIRRTELVRLRVCDFDLVNKIIIIPAVISKNGEQESVVIPVGLEPILKRMGLEHYPSGFYVFGRASVSGRPSV